MPTVVSERIPKWLRTKKIQKLDLFRFHPELSPRETKQNGVESLLSSLDSDVPPKEKKEVGNKNESRRLFIVSAYSLFAMCSFLFVDETVKYRQSIGGDTTPTLEFTGSSSWWQAPSCPMLTHLFSDYHEANPIHELNSSLLFESKGDYLLK